MLVAGSWYVRRSENVGLALVGAGLGTRAGVCSAEGGRFWRDLGLLFRKICSISPPPHKKVFAPKEFLLLLEELVGLGFAVRWRRQAGVICSGKGARCISILWEGGAVLSSSVTCHRRRSSSNGIELRGLVPLAFQATVWSLFLVDRARFLDFSSVFAAGGGVGSSLRFCLGKGSIAVSTRWRIFRAATN